VAVRLTQHSRRTSIESVLATGIVSAGGGANSEEPIANASGLEATRSDNPIANDGGKEDFLQASVALSGSETRLNRVRFDEDPNKVDSDSVRVFTEANEEWQQQDELLLDDGTPALFGKNLALSVSIVPIGGQMSTNIYWYK
jgi:hypothetical protein